MLVSKKSRRNSRDASKKGKSEQIVGSGSQEQESRHGKGGIRIKDGEESPISSAGAKNQANQWAQGQERKGNTIRNDKEILSTVGKGGSKGKEVLRDGQDLGKGLLGSGPTKGLNMTGRPPPTLDSNKASSSAQTPASPKELASRSNPLDPPQGAGPLADKGLGPINQPAIQMVVGPNDTKMQIVSISSSPKMSRQPNARSPLAAERTKSRKGSPRQSKKGTPVKLQASKALHVWSPVKDRKVKAKARMASLTLQEINAWTGAMKEANSSLDQTDTCLVPTENSASVGDPATAPASSN
ncbi:unnamed protein product [Linum trigynum]|uniref:Uncharacterized protein n=1 Tax=Linum trigynum TaxID=586398 RepID=A0AAV2FSL3_9ROSI